MKKTALWKNAIRDITSSPTRYIAILVMLLLGTYVFIGLVTIGPTMEATLIDYADSYEMPDLTIENPFGLDHDDVALAKELSHIDRLTTCPQGSQVVKSTKHVLFLEGIPEFPRLDLIKGRLPEAIDEIVLESFAEDDYHIGESLYLDNGGKDVPDVLQQHHFKVVGFVDSASHLVQLEAKTVGFGDGQVDYMAWIHPEVFTSDAPGVIRLRFSDTAHLAGDSTEYRHRVDAHAEQAKALFAERPDRRLNELMTSAAEQIDSAEQILREEDYRLDQGQQVLRKSEQRLHGTRRELAALARESDRKTQDAQRQLNNAAKTLAKEKQGLLSAQQQILTAKRQLANARTAIQQGEENIHQGQGQLQREKNRLDSGRQRHSTGLTKLVAGEKQLKEGQKTLHRAKQEWQSQGQLLTDGQRQIQIGEQALEKGSRALDLQENNLAQGANQLIRGKKELERKSADLEQGKKQLIDLKNQYTGLNQQLAMADREKNNAIASERERHANATAELSRKLSETMALERELKKELDNDPTNLLLRLRLLAVQRELSTIQRDLAIAQKTHEGTLNAIEAGFQEKTRPLQEGIMALGKGITAGEEKISQGERALADGRRQLVQKEGELLSGRTRIKQNRLNLNREKDRLKQEKKQLKAAKNAWQQGGLQIQNQQNELDRQGLALKQSKRTLEQGREELKNGQKEWQNADNNLKDSKARLNNKNRELTTTELQLKSNEAQWLAGYLAWSAAKDDWERANAQLKGEQSKGKRQLEGAFFHWDQSFHYFLQEEARSQHLIPEAVTQLNEQSDKLRDSTENTRRLAVPTYQIHTRFNDYGYATYHNYAVSIGLMARIFPLFFYLVALLICLTTMLRMIDESRTQIGTLKALGYANRDIISHYLLYGLVAAIPAGVLGSILAVRIMVPTIWDTYSVGFIFREPVYDINPWHLLLGFVINLLCTVVAAWLATRNHLRVQAAALLQPKPPSIGNRILLEKITPLWRRLSFQQKITARNLFRYKKRSALTILGVSGCMALLIVGFSLNHAVENLFQLQFSDLQRHHLIVSYDGHASNDDLIRYHDDLTEAGKTRHNNAVCLKTGHFTLAGSSDQLLSIVVPKDIEAFKTQVTLRQRHGHQPIDLKKGAVLSERSANRLQLKAGDSIEYEDLFGHTRRIPIAGICENYAGHYLYLDAAHYQSVFGEEPVWNANYITLENPKQESAFAEMILKNAIVLGVSSNAAISDGIDSFSDAISTMVLVILFVSMSLALVVLYNLTNINVEERMRELSTIKVLGFYAKEVTAYIYRETGLLTISGILIGLPIGKMLEGGILEALSPPEFMMDPSIPLKSYGLSIFFTLLVSLLVLFIMHRKLKRIDMVEALKGVE